MLLYSFTADSAVYAIALGRPPIQRSYAVAKSNPSLADIQSSLALMQTTLQRIETTQADQGATLTSAACTVPLASCFAILEITASTAGKHILSTAELVTIATQTTGAAVAIYGVIYTILTQIQKNQKTP